MAITFNGGTLASYTDTTANDTTFTLAEGQIDNTPGQGSPGVGDLFDSTPSTYSYVLTGAGVQTIAGGTLVTNAFGQLIVASDGRYQFVPNAAGINALPAGQQVVNYTVQVTDATGETASTIFTLQLTGATDAPTLAGGTLATYNDTAATDSFAVQAGRIDNDSTGNTNGVGNVRGDNGSTYTYAITGAGVANSVINGQNVGTELVGTYGRLVLATDGRYQYVPNSAAINAVPAGSNPVDTFTIRINDSNGTSATSTFTVQVNGATETAVSLTGGTLATFTDTAANDSFGLVTGQLDTDATAANNGTPGSGTLDGGTGAINYQLTGAGVNAITVDGTVVGTQLSNEFGRLTIATDGRYQFEPNSGAINALPAGARTLTYAVQVTDGNGTTATANYTINLTGATETQTLTGGQLAAYADTAAFDTFAVREGTIDTNPTSAANGIGQLVGDTGTRTYSLTSGAATNIVVGGVVVGQEINTFYGRLVLATDGRYQFTPNETNINSLSSGVGGNLNFNVQVATTNGAVTSTSNANFTVNLTGTTDTAPVLTSGILATYVDNEATDVFAVRQGNFDTDRTGGRNDTTFDGLLDGGTGALTYSIVGANVTNVVVGGTVVGYQSVGTYGRLTVSTDGRYQFEPNSATIDALPLGTNPMDTFAIRVTDANGASSTANYSVNITGGTDAPTVNQSPASPYFTQIAETDAALSVTGRVEGVDRAGNTLTYGYNPVNPAAGGQTNSFSFVSTTNSPVTLTAAQQATIAQGFSVNAQTGAYTFNLASPDFLDPGQTLIAGFRVTVTNQFGETTSQFVQVNIAGTIEQGPAGTTGDDRLNGGAFGDLINGGTGDDIIVGAGGNDQLFGGSGDDVLRGGSGFNTIDGGSGNDTGILEGLRSSYSFQQTGPDTFTARNLNGTETHQFISVENFQFSDGTIVTFSQLFPS